jgi:RNA polymerase-interacting CarD/CdnL/TRCF family regulator
MTRDKLSAGDARSLAEVVRDGARLDNSHPATGGTPALSPSERQLYLKARRLLVDELQSSRGLDAGEADAWISKQLASTVDFDEAER